MDWKPGQIAIGILVGLAAGLAVGQVHVRIAAAPAERSQQRAALPSMATTPRAETTRATAATPEAAPPNVPGAIGGPSPAALQRAVETAAREAQLRTQIRDLQESLDKLKTQADPLVAAPLARPPDLAPRFEEKALTQTVTSMIQGINPKAEVTAVDCTEYPCIVYGTGLTIEQAKSLKDAPAFQAYQGDHGSMGMENDTFSFWVVPKDDPNPLDAIELRTGNRITAMSAANRPH